MLDRLDAAFSAQQRFVGDAAHELRHRGEAKRARALAAGLGHGLAAGRAGAGA